MQVRGAFKDSGGRGPRVGSSPGRRSGGLPGGNAERSEAGSAVEEENAGRCAHGTRRPFERRRRAPLVLATSATPVLSGTHLSRGPLADSDRSNRCVDRSLERRFEKHGLAPRLPDPRADGVDSFFLYVEYVAFSKARIASMTARRHERSGRAGRARGGVRAVSAAARPRGKASGARAAVGVHGESEAGSRVMRSCGGTGKRPCVELHGADGEPIRVAAEMAGRPRRSGRRRRR